MGKRRGKEIVARAPDAHEIDLRLRHRERMLADLRLSGWRHLARQGIDLGGGRGIGENRQAQAVAQGVARRVRLADGRARPAAPLGRRGIGVASLRTIWAARHTALRACGASRSRALFRERDLLRLRFQHGLAQLAAQGRAMAVDLAQGGIAARFRGHDHAIDALDVVELNTEALGDDAFEPDAGGDEMLLDRRNGARLARGPAPGEPIRLRPADQRRQPMSQRLAGARRHQASLEAAQPKRLPDQIDDIADPNLLENIGLA